MIVIFADGTRRRITSRRTTPPMIAARREVRVGRGSSGRADVEGWSQIASGRSIPRTKVTAQDGLGASSRYRRYMRFEKWHGIGNDFVMLADPDDRVTLTPETVKALCDRRFGIGADGVIRVAPGPDGTHLFMDYVN